MEESTSLCTNCQRPIAASNFVIHSLHCQRNLTKCEKCGEAVPRSALDEHESEFHSKVNCPDCHLSVEKPQLETHKKTACISRQQHCQFCELELPASEMYEHENYCGSRTKKCEDCGEYVMLKYEQLHIDSNHGFLKLDDGGFWFLIFIQYYIYYFSSNLIDCGFISNKSIEPGPIATWIKNDLESGSSRPPKSNNNQKPQLYTGKFDTGDEDEDDDMHSLFANLMKKKKVIAPAAYPGVAYPISDRPQRTISKSPPPYQEVMDDSTDLVALPCEFCEAMIPVNQLILHQTACRMDLTSFGRAKKSQNESSKKNYSGLVINDSDNEADEVDEVTKRQGRKIGGFTDSRLGVLRRNAIDEGNTDRHRNHSSADQKSSVDEGTEAALREDLDDDGVYLPCEFCGDGYPPSLLLEHQDVCEYHPKSFREVQEVWPEKKDSVERPQDSQIQHRLRKFDESYYNTFVESANPDQQPNNGEAQLRRVPTPTTLQPGSNRDPTSHHSCSTSPKQNFTFRKLTANDNVNEKCTGLVTQRNNSKISDHIAPGKMLSGENTSTDPKMTSLSSFYKPKPQSSSSKLNSLTVTSFRKSEYLSPQTDCSKMHNRRHPPIPEHAIVPIVKITSQIQPGARGKSNISNSYNDIRGNFTVASEWSDDSDSRPTSATGAIPKQKAGKLNIARKVNQEAQSTRSSNPLMANHSRVVVEKGNVISYDARNQRYQIRNNLKDENGGDDEDDDDE
ncbi:TRAF-type zinc finger domain-containing protein 1 [Frankliniella fusca]|uniref:TRAF-type zinc finger domain-containing protein 1 n=1 Tax=Frankliniella fusca TaxID=407009 RepID=A0AAE1I0P3_9NEOP|nr:TRAF-type zinc finger domain-containing protein 1 [Frankliniella fusca]